MTPLPLDPAALGATLYVPATRGDLFALATGARLPQLRSLVFCLEDAVHVRDSGAAFANLRAVLGQLAAVRDLAGPALFVRPRDAALLERIVRLPGAEVLDGFVIPKATADTLPAYLAALPFAHQSIMPTLETREAFEPAEMVRQRAQLLAVAPRVLTVRIGGNDLLQTLGTRRSTTRTAYDGPLGAVIANLVTTFVPWGFAMSAPVFESFADHDRLRDEVERDLEHGLLTKSAIHPAQVGVIHNAYRVAEVDFEIATAMLNNDAPAIFGSSGMMCEPATHRGWAAATRDRATLFGVVRSEPTLSLFGVVRNEPTLSLVG